VSSVFGDQRAAAVLPFQTRQGFIGATPGSVVWVLDQLCTAAWSKPFCDDSVTHIVECTHIALQLRASRHSNRGTKTCDDGTAQTDTALARLAFFPDVNAFLRLSGSSILRKRRFPTEL